MFFIHVMGRKNRSLSAKTHEELGRKVEKEIKDNANDNITVSIGKDDSAVMPFVWISRNLDTDEWEGEAGDSIKLGIEDGLIKELDPVQMLGLNQAIQQGIASMYDDGPVRVVSIKEPTENAPRKKKPSEQELQNKANKLVQDLFTNLHKEK